MQETQPPLPAESEDSDEAAATAHSAAATGATHVATAQDAADGTVQKAGKRQRATASAAFVGAAAATGASAQGGAEGGQTRKQRRTDRRGLEKKGGRARALVSKWQHVAKELEEDDVRNRFSSRSIQPRWEPSSMLPHTK